jgi:hypothetical protein
VQHPKHNINPYSEDELVTTLEDVIGHDSNHPININKVLAMINEKGGRKHVYPGNIHCKAVLAVLILFAHNLSAADVNKLSFIAELLQVMFTCIIIMLINLM